MAEKFNISLNLNEDVFIT